MCSTDTQVSCSCETPVLSCPHLPPALVSLTVPGPGTLGVTQVLFVTRHQPPVFTTPALLVHLLHTQSITALSSECVCVCVCVTCLPVCRSHSSLGDTSWNRCVSNRTDGGHMCPHMEALPLCRAETTLHTHTHTDVRVTFKEQQHKDTCVCRCVCAGER